MADLLLVPSPGGWLALSRDAYDSARKAARDAGFGEISAPSGCPAPPEALCDAASLAESLGVPQSWVEQAARQGRIPCVRLGRWVRFRRAEVEAHLAPQDRPKLGHRGRP